MEKFLREWRQDALNKAQYDSAIFIGDKLLAMTKDDNDAFWLAQVHYAAGNYTRAQTLLAKQDLINSNASCRYLAAHCLIRQNQFNEALALLGEHSPTHLFSSNAKRKTSGRVNPRTAPGRAGSKAPDRLDSRDRERTGSDDSTDEESATRRYEAAMCYLRGLCYAKQNAFERAKEAYKDALRIDVQCYEAFNQLVKNSLMSPDEEDEFMQKLSFNSVRASASDDTDGADSMEDEPANYVQMLYQTQLSKYRNPRAFNSAIESLSTHYGLARNADILLARADLLYTQCRFKDALSITEAILDDDKYNFAVYPVHLACLYELRKNNVLFLIAHELADSHPDEPCTWLAVGIYYFATGKIADARRFFSKASMMDANFGPAWIGFAHTFAAEGEHDQAVTAYSTAARLFTGTHLPQVFLGMQNHAMNNMTAAEEFLKTAYSLCRTDPLLLNEMGIVFYHQDKLKDAAKLFMQALRIADEMESDPHAWLGARTNLGHAYRRLRMHDQALEEFDQVLRDGGKDAAVFCAKGLIYLDKGMPDEAVRVLHEALARGHWAVTACGAGWRRGGDETAEADFERFEQELAQKKYAAKMRLESKALMEAKRARGDKGKAVAKGGGGLVGRRSGRLVGSRGIHGGDNGGGLGGEESVMDISE
ncbi:anaphase-promoting complex-like protein [Bombardia bombarda]|uniref:Anaphase-promoting complex-like protein n=1 Tax=Bombardia bombarda TaxID=252184 RepID=A0AA39WI58_9PEZI|nr:anaphase-promoting complex-like protein [Bombardia bombarda]